MKTFIQLESVTVNFPIGKSSDNSLKSGFTQLFNRDKVNRPYGYKALDSINLRINTGEKIGIIGGNGAGKSTLLRVISKIYIPTIGSVKVQGKVAPLLEFGAGFNPELTGLENIYFNGAILGLTPDHISSIKEEVIEFSGLQKFIDTQIKYYSSGMQARLAFSMATAVRPEILVLDEMFAGGDYEFVRKAKTRMDKMINDSDIMILVSHNMNDLMQITDRVIWLKDGKIKSDGKPDLVVKEYIENTS